MNTKTYIDGDWYVGVCEDEDGEPQYGILAQYNADTVSFWDEDDREHSVGSYDFWVHQNDDIPEREDGFRDAVEADADVLRSAGMGTDEDYGYFGGDEG